VKRRGETLVSRAGGAITTGAVQLCSVAVGTPLDYYLYVPPEAGHGAHILAAVHGIAGQAAEQALLLAPFAERHGVVLVAPCFANPPYRAYQRLGTREVRADRALERAVEEVARVTGANASQLFLMGYSGGAQFVHRYAMAHPKRVAAAVVAAAGWYTYPDPTVPFPYGMAPAPRLPDLHFDVEALLRVPMLVAAGEWDVERDAALRQGPEIDRLQGPHRLERARRWVEAMRGAARDAGRPSAVSFRELPRTNHSFLASVRRGGLAELAFEFLFASEKRASGGSTGVTT
jgi:pimeloyl-ACP methyl ester carboxylesterase